MCSTKYGSTYCKPWSVDIGLNGRVTKFKVDTGADVSVIGRELADDLNVQEISNNLAKLFGLGKFQLPVSGCFEADMQFDWKSSIQRVYTVHY